MTEMLIERVRRKLASLQRPAWAPVTSKGDGPRTTGKFAGLPYLAAAEKWPVCEDCHAPLTFFVQLDLAGLPAPLRGRYGTGLLQLFYCLDCSPWEPFTAGSLARRIDPVGPGSDTPCPIAKPFPPLTITGWKPLAPEFPCWDELPELLSEKGLELSEDEQEAYGEEIAPEQGDKLAGWPFWVQSTEYPACPVCAQRMQVVLQIDSEKNLPYMFGDAGIGHLTQCPYHQDVLGFGWACY